ncbi:hypothetical protein [Richelia intracellularis]|nr:hypothetical protein [Richelia intracellularis]
MELGGSETILGFAEDCI